MGVEPARWSRLTRRLRIPAGRENDAARAATIGLEQELFATLLPRAANTYIYPINTPGKKALAGSVVENPHKPEKLHAQPNGDLTQIDPRLLSAKAARLRNILRLGVFASSYVQRRVRCALPILI
jgi:uncharacterized membrane protein